MQWAGLLTDAADAVDVVLCTVGEREVDDKGQPTDVNAARCHIRADQEAHLPLLERLQARETQD